MRRSCRTPSRFTHTHRGWRRLSFGFLCPPWGVLPAERQRVSAAPAPVVQERQSNSRSPPFVALTHLQQAFYTIHTAFLSSSVFLMILFSLHASYDGILSTQKYEKTYCSWETQNITSRDVLRAKTCKCDFNVPLPVSEHDANFAIFIIHQIPIMASKPSQCYMNYL